MIKYTCLACLYFTLVCIHVSYADYDGIPNSPFDPIQTAGINNFQYPGALPTTGLQPPHMMYSNPGIAQSFSMPFYPSGYGPQPQPQQVSTFPNSNLPISDLPRFLQKDFGRDFTDILSGEAIDNDEDGEIDIKVVKGKKHISSDDFLDEDEEEEDDDDFEKSIKSSKKTQVVSSLEEACSGDTCISTEMPPDLVTSDYDEHTLPQAERKLKLLMKYERKYAEDMEKASEWLKASRNAIKQLENKSNSVREQAAEDKNALDRIHRVESRLRRRISKDHERKKAARELKEQKQMLKNLVENAAELESTLEEISSQKLEIAKRIKNAKLKLGKYHHS